MISLKIAGFCTFLMFYGGFFIKMLHQKKRGVKTNRMLMGDKSKTTHVCEFCLQFLTLFIAFFQYLSIKKITPIIVFSKLTIPGMILIGSGILIFYISMYTMKDSWHSGIDTTKTTSFVRSGIYKYSRNPAFVGFDLFYAGFTLVFPNIYLILISILGIISFHLQILQEEKYLPALFGQEYVQYKKTTPRYFFLF